MVGSNGNTKEIIFDRHECMKDKKLRLDKDKNVPESGVRLVDIHLHVRNEYGDANEEDCSCDSAYMLKAMDRVGMEIRKSFHWVPPEQDCYLVMDNAGGHGTTHAILEYTDHLHTKYNISIIWQVPRSPFTNVLDLGVWMCMQAKVERMHFLKRSTTLALVESVEQVWNGVDLGLVMTKVFNKLNVVLCNILRGEGGNDLVEENRGMKKANIKIEKGIREIEKEKSTQQVDLLDFDGFVDEDNDDQIPLLFEQQTV